jgi:serine/threonine-protein kinase
MTIAAIFATGAALWGWMRPIPKPVARFSLALPEAEALRTVDFGLRLAISPDGSRMVYVGPSEGSVQLWVREFDQLNARPLPGTEGGRNPFFSPDGEQVGFFIENPWTLKVTSLSGAPPITLTDSSIGSGGGAWGPDGYLYIDTDRGGLQRMPASGGPRESVAPLDTARDEIGVAWPVALPNGKGVLFRIRSAGQELNEYDIAAVNVETGERKTLVRGLVARYAASGHLVFVTADGNLFAVPFDQDKLEMTGTPKPLLEGLGVGPRGAVDFRFSDTGTLVYATGSAAGAADLVWVNRQGAAELVDPEWEGNRSVQSIALSPDGTRLAASLIAEAGAGEHIWVKQLDRGPASRITFEGAANMRPAWTPDGRSVLFLSDRGSQAGALYRKRADGTGSAEFLATHEYALAEGALSPDGHWLVTRTSTSLRGSGDILALQIGVDTALVPLLATRIGEVTPALSPDGRYLAYASNESGRREIYVRPFPNVDEARWQVSTNGGIEPVWAHSGQELFYFNLNDELVSAQVQTTPTFVVGDQRVLFSAVTYARSGLHQSYGVSPDDQRFIMLRIQGSKDSGLVVIQNFFEELNARVAN